MKEVIMNDKCVFCGNIGFSEKQVQYIYKKDDKLMIVNDLPCKVCNFCGEQYIDGKDLEEIEKYFDEINQKKRDIRNTIEIPVEAYSEIIH